MGAALPGAVRPHHQAVFDFDEVRRILRLPVQLVFGFFRFSHFCVARVTHIYSILIFLLVYLQLSELC